MACLLAGALCACGAPVPVAYDSGQLRSALSPSVKVVWVVAHPDDESMVAGVLLAKACAVDGAACTLVVMQNGRYGRCKPESVADGSCPCPTGQTECSDVMGQARAKELLDCAQVFHATGLVLARDGQADEAHAAETVRLLHQLWARYRPEVIITHGTKGGYGHPAHVWTSAVVTRAWRELPAAGRPALYYALDLTNRTVDDDAVTDTLAGTEAIDPSLGLRDATLWDLVMRALAQHRTQTALNHMSELPRDRWRSSFHRVDAVTGR
jgi:LmbE family N-acetylglucosaminyl deacetylase